MDHPQPIGRNTSILLIHPENDPIDDIVEKVRQIAPNYKVWTAIHDELIDEKKLKDVEIAAGKGLPKGLKHSKKLQWYHHNAAGVAWIFEYGSPEEITFQTTNISGLHAIQVTEHVFGMIHTLNRDMMNFHVSKKEKHWKKPRTLQLETLPGKSILIVGFGKIGTRIAKIAKAHDMQVLAIRRNKTKTAEHADKVGSLEDLHSFLIQADIIVSVLPDTPETEGIFSTNAFDNMKPTSLFINVGRGAHVDESALIHSLKAKKIRGAGLDVFQTEPLPTESDLWNTPNLIISPHSSGELQNYTRNAYGYFLKNLKRYMEGKSLNNLVDKHHGY